MQPWVPSEAVLAIKLRIGFVRMKIILEQMWGYVNRLRRTKYGESKRVCELGFQLITMMRMLPVSEPGFSIWVIVNFCDVSWSSIFYAARVSSWISGIGSAVGRKISVGWFQREDLLQFMCKKVGWCWNDWNDADDVDDTTAGLKFDFFMCSKSLDWSTRSYGLLDSPPLGTFLLSLWSNVG